MEQPGRGASTAHVGKDGDTLGGEKGDEDSRLRN